jgi:anti-sigma factor RsiW
MHGTQPVSCHQLREGLTEYLDDALPPQRRQGFDTHLGRCPECRRLCCEVGLTIERLASAPRETMPPAMRRTLLEAFRNRPPS